MCSLHANSARDALVKLSTLPLLAGRNIDASFVVPTVASTIDIVVHAELERGGRRRIVEITAPTGATRGSSIEAVSLFGIRGGRLEATGEMPVRSTKFVRAGADVERMLRDVDPGLVA